MEGLALSPSLSKSQRAAAREVLLSTPGVLGSGASCAVSLHYGLLRPHPSVLQARRDFAFILIRNAFAVRERLAVLSGLFENYFSSFCANGLQLRVCAFSLYFRCA